MMPSQRNRDCTNVFMHWLISNNKNWIRGMTCRTKLHPVQILHLSLSSVLWRFKVTVTPRTVFKKCLKESIVGWWPLQARGQCELFWSAALFALPFCKACRSTDNFLEWVILRLISVIHDCCCLGRNVFENTYVGSRQYMWRAVLAIWHPGQLPGAPTAPHPWAPPPFSGLLVPHSSSS